MSNAIETSGLTQRTQDDRTVDAGADEYEQFLMDAANHPPTENCPEPECVLCGFRDCPHGEVLHYHHDGCPQCSLIPPGRYTDNDTHDQKEAKVAHIATTPDHGAVADPEPSATTAAARGDDVNAVSHSPRPISSPTPLA